MFRIAGFELTSDLARIVLDFVSPDTDWPRSLLGTDWLKSLLACKAVCFSWNEIVKAYDDKWRRILLAHCPAGVALPHEFGACARPCGLPLPCHS